MAALHLLGIETVARLDGHCGMRSRLTKTGSPMRSGFRLAAQGKAGYTGENGKLSDVVFHICCLVRFCYER